MLARTPILFMISHIIWGTTLLVDGKQIVCKNRAMGAWGKTREIWCWKSTSFAGKIRKGKTKREVGNQFQRKLNRVNMQFSRREKNTKNKRILNLQGKISRNRWMDGKQKRRNVGRKGRQKNRKNWNRNKYGRRWPKKKKRRNMISKVFHFHLRDHSDDEKSSFFIHIFINIESFLIVKLWNANIEMSWCRSYSFSFYRVGGSAFLWVVLGISKWAFLVRVGFEAAYKYMDKKAKETKKIENKHQKKDQKSPCQFILREVRKFPYIWVNCYCWGNSSMVEGRFSKWF